MIDRVTLGNLLVIAALSLSLSGCGASNQASSSPNSSAPVTSSSEAPEKSEDGVRSFIEAARDRVPMINSSTDEEIAKIGEDICVDPEDLGMSSSAADDLHKSSLVLGNHASSMAEAAVLVGLAKQHLCRPV